MVNPTYIAGKAEEEEEEEDERGGGGGGGTQEIFLGSQMIKKK